MLPPRSSPSWYAPTSWIARSARSCCNISSHLFSSIASHQNEGPISVQGEVYVDMNRKGSKKMQPALVFSLAIALLPVAAVSITRQRSTIDTTQQGGRDEVRIELTSDGFNPSAVQHAPGTFAISVENKTLSGDYTLRLKAEDGTVLSELQVQKGSSAWTVSLQSGRYTLTEVNHSQWTCSIVVQE